MITWIICGISFLIAEILTNTFFMIFLSLGCFANAILHALYPLPYYQEVIFGASIAIFSTIFLRGSLQNMLFKKITFKSDIGKHIPIVCDIAPQEQKRIHYQGTTWPAINIDNVTLKKSDQAIIENIDGNILLIKKLTYIGK